MEQRDPPVPSARQRSQGREIAIVLVVCSAALLAGYVLKACPAALERNRSGFACHTDITALYHARGIDRGVVPYVNGRVLGEHENGQLTGYELRLGGGANEYPVLTGFFMWGVGYLAADQGQYLMVTALLLAPFGLLISFLLVRMVGLRALLWAASPALVLYAFHNWDLLVVAAATAGLWAWWRRRTTLAGVLFGIGAALKFYPLLFLVPLGLERWRAGDRRAATSAIGAGVAVVVLVNLPVFLAGPEGWLVTYRFHTLRPPNYDSLWGVGSLYALGPGVLNLLTSGLLVASVGGILWVGHRRAREEGAYPFVQVCGALVAAYLLWGKVHSPQFVLWILPFFGVLGVKVRWWAAYMIDNLALYFGVFVLGTFSISALELVVSTAVYVRAGLLLALTVLFLRSGTTFRPPMVTGSGTSDTGRSLPETSPGVAIGPHPSVP